VFSLMGPDLAVVDVGGVPHGNRGVYFLDRDRFVANTEPFFVPRSRPVPAGTPASGLRLLRSRGTGWTRLRIDGQVAGSS
jgi:hypothetical protein